MKKTISKIFGVIFLFASGGAMTAQNVSYSKNDIDAQNKKYFQQVYKKNEYVIDQLETLARTKKVLPHRMGGYLTYVDMVLLSIKFNSVNFLMQKTIVTDEVVSFQSFNEDLVFDEVEIVKQSNALLMKVPALYENYNMSLPVAFNESPASGFFKSTVTTEELYKQLIRIESFLSALRNAVEPENVYEVVMATRALLLGMCGSLNNVKNVPLVMGKRPKDVYSRLFDYIGSFSSRNNFFIPTKASVHVLPSDVFDVAIIAMAYSRVLQGEKSSQLVKLEIEEKAIYFMPEIITPSHVYQAVAQNMEILECAHHAV